MEHVCHGRMLTLSGSLDVRCTAELRAIVYRLILETEGDVEIDISGVESVDLTALKMLAVANRAAERQGGRVVLCGGSPAVRRLLHLSQLRWLLPVRPHRAADVIHAAG